jgi:hypothetical protein
MKDLEIANRYFVDERGGCIAVRDRTLTDPEYQGLHEDTTGVMWFEMGERVEGRCPTCGHDRGKGWNISDAQREYAAKVATQLEAKFAGHGF